jgi:hypothetical protein
VLVNSSFLNNTKYSYVKAISRYTKIVATLYNILLQIAFSSVHQFTDALAGVINISEVYARVVPGGILYVYVVYN